MVAVYGNQYIRELIRKLPIQDAAITDGVKSRFQTGDVSI